MKFRIRPVHSEDIGDFLRVYKESYRGLEEYAYTKNRQIRSYFRWMLSRDREGFMVAETQNNQNAVGFVMVDANWFSPFELEKVGEVHEVVILPEYRNMGLGRLLMERGIEYAKEKKRKVMELWVGYKNYKAQKFYQKMGFERKSTFGKWIRMIRIL